MSFTINLMNNSSAKNVVNKNLTQLSSIDGVLKEATSILNPTVKIQGMLPVNCNYFHIPNFDRYYYITDIRSINNDIFEISGHVDVLTTYRDQILRCSGIVARQRNVYNLYLDDGSFKTYQNPTFKIEVFPQGFSNPEFVLAVAGR